MRTASRLTGIAPLALCAALALAGCSSGGGGGGAKVKTGSVSVSTVSLMSEMDMPRAAPIMLRLFKEEAVVEVWKQERNGRYGLLRAYPICRFSGRLGPKISTGDHQAPEGFYDIDQEALNPWSRNHLAFNTGFPNAYDRSLGRTGDHLMIHGGCKSVGCYAMTNDRIEEIYGLARESLASGQASIQLQAYPFRMTEENFRRHADDPNVPFWRMLKQGSDMFVQTRRPVRVAACSGRYGFAPGGTKGSDDAVCAGAGSMAAASPAPSAYQPSADDGRYPPADGQFAPADDGQSPAQGDQFDR